MNKQRKGILAGGNFIMDHVKIIDGYPEENMLATILRETSSNGGGPYNVLKDLAAMQVGYPLEAAGLVGADANGAWIQADCRAAGIDTTQLRQTDRAPTSYTDAMTVASTGRRTFFHQRGANALLGEEDFDFSETNARIFHLAYLMLLDEMDREVADGGSIAARVLAAAQKAGLETSVDIVSTENPRFREIAEAALPHTDHLIINEIEAGKVAGMDLRGVTDVRLISKAALALMERGVRQQVIIHFEQGAVVAGKDASVVVQGSLELPQEFIVGATGAGDAFAAGCLHGIHEGWSTESTLELAVCTAASCLRDATPSNGLQRVAECLEYAARYPLRILR